MNKDQDIHWLREQVVDLQSQLAFQEDTLQTLNAIVTRQQQQIEYLNELCTVQRSQLDRLASDMAPGVAVDKPPHY